MSTGGDARNQHALEVVGTPNQGSTFMTNPEFDNSVPAILAERRHGIQKPLATAKYVDFQSNDVNTGVDTIWNRSGRSKVAPEKLTTRAGYIRDLQIELLFEPQRSKTRPRRKN